MFLRQLHDVLDALIVDCRVADMKFCNVGFGIVLLFIVRQVLVPEHFPQQDNRHDHTYNAQGISNGASECHVGHFFIIGWLYL